MADSVSLEALQERLTKLEEQHKKDKEALDTNRELVRRQEVYLTAVEGAIVEMRKLVRDVKAVKPEEPNDAQVVGS